MGMTGCTGIILPTHHRHLPKDLRNPFMRTPCPPIGNLGSGRVTVSVVSCSRSCFVHKVDLFVCLYSIFWILPSLSFRPYCDICCFRLLFPCSPSSYHRRDVMLCFLVSSCFALISICSSLLSFLIQLIRKLDSLEVPAEGI